MILTDFKESMNEPAMRLAFENYLEEKSVVSALPAVNGVPSLMCFAENGLGVAAFEGEKLIGFLGCEEPWENAFASAAKGTFTPVHAHGALRENREKIYMRLYQAAAEKWVKRGIMYHAVALYAHDAAAINAFFTYGFGNRCADAVRDMSDILCSVPGGFTFGELSKSDVIKIRAMRRALSQHLGSSPCFMDASESSFEKWILRAERRDSRVFAAFDDSGSPVAFVEFIDAGETFLTENTGMKSICGAYCEPKHRGMDLVPNVINCALKALRAENYTSIGVDCESFNPTANAFWSKYFTLYTKSLTRRIDECAPRKKVT